MKTYIIDEKSKGKKLFRFIKGILPGLKNSEIFKLIRKKVVTVNGKKTNPEYLPASGDRVEIYLKDEHFETKGKKRKFISVKNDLDVVYEDNTLLVVNKPLGVLSHPDKADYKNNIYEMARSYLYNKGEFEPETGFSPALCNRLDRNTTGLIVIAKTHTALKTVTAQFRERDVVKIYRTLVYGEVASTLLITSMIDASGMISAVSKLKTHATIPDKAIFFEQSPALSATLVTPLAVCGRASYVEVNLWTGKKHQIRAHLKAAGYPLLGDHKYFTRPSTELSRKLKLSGYYLHAFQLKLKDSLLWEAPLPADFIRLKDKLLQY